MSACSSSKTTISIPKKIDGVNLVTLLNDKC